MRASIAQYLNEIVSLSLLALMAVALIAGQAAAEPQQHPVIEEIPTLVIDIDFNLRHEGE